MTITYPRHQTHLRVRENWTLCEEAGERTPVQVWGEFLVDDRALVGCPRCLEWMHA